MKVDSRHALGNSAGDLVFDDSRASSKFGCTDPFAPLATEEHHFLADLGFIEFCDIHNGHIHRDGSDDWEAATNLVETMGLNTAGRTPEMLRAMKMHFIGGWGGFALIGTKEQIVDGLARLSALGLDGVVVSWPRYIEDMLQFQRSTLPLLQQAGLR